MDKRYQVFVSSTYTDLIEERHSIMRTLMKMDCIPAGMEHFPAADEEQWNFIKRIIDYSDYYLLIIGGRYGSLDDDGISFTEKEYDYAVSKNIKVVALIHGSPDMLSYQNSEQEPELRKKLESFRDKVKNKRLVDFWKDPVELVGKVALGIMNARTMYPAIGWVRANRIVNEENLIEMNELRKENNKLLIKTNNLEKEASQNNPISLAGMETNFKIHYKGYIDSYNRQRVQKQWEADLTWNEIFHHISPLITSFKTPSLVGKEIAKLAEAKTSYGGSNMSVEQQDLFTIGIQFQAYGLIKIENLKVVNGGRADFWILTPKGNNLMIELRTVRE